jgi:hypothetical protein
MQPMCICLDCVHLVSMDSKICAAYPYGIPDEIWGAKVQHFTPYKGDHGIVFKPKL